MMASVDTKTSINTTITTCFVLPSLVIQTLPLYYDTGLLFRSEISCVQDIYKRAFLMAVPDLPNINPRYLRALYRALYASN